ncbi:MAG: CARDB domain-containing protein [Acidobacteriota bacterium]
MTKIAILLFASMMIQQPPAGPDLAPFQPDGWTAALVLSNQPGTNASEPLVFGDAVFVDWAVLNQGSGAVQSGFRVSLRWQGKAVASAREEHWTFDALPSDRFVSAEDFQIGPLPPGEYSLRLAADSLSDVAESDESNNTLTTSFVVGQEAAGDLVFSPLAGWPGALLLLGTTGPAPEVLTAGRVLGSWSVLNQGTAIQSQFLVSLTVDGNRPITWQVDGLPPGGYASREGFTFALSPGPHELRLVADTGDAIAEADESNNTLTLIVEVVPAPADICAGRDDACCAAFGDDLPTLDYHPTLNIRMGAGGFIEFIERPITGVANSGQFVLCGNPLMQELKFLADVVAPNGPVLRFAPQEPGDSVEVGSKGAPFSRVSFNVRDSLTIRRRGLPVWSIDGSGKGRQAVRIDGDLLVTGAIVTGNGPLTPRSEAALIALQREVDSLRAAVEALQRSRGKP